MITPEPSTTLPAMTHADRFEPLPDEVRDRWLRFAQWDTTYFPKHVGLVVEDVRQDYCRMRLPFRTEVIQPQGIVHGGAMATAADTVVVPAIATHYAERRRLSTVDMSVQFLGPVTSDLVIEGWVTKRGRSVVFCQVEMRDESGELAATAQVVYKVGRRVEEFEAGR